MGLSDYTREELEAELGRRDQRLPPRLLQTPSIAGLVELFERQHRGEALKDFEYYVYEAAAEALYGPKYFEWRNSVTLPGDD